MPGWGERPGEIAAAVNNLLKATPDEINQGLDWRGLFAALPNSSRIVAYTTWADSTTGGPDNPDPAAYIHSVLPPGMREGGESTGNGQTTTTGERLMFNDAVRWDWYVVNWCFNKQPQTPLQVDHAFVSARNA